MFRANASLLFMAALLLNACAGASPDDSESDDDLKNNPKLAQMNDVSTLLPLAKTQDEFNAYLAPTSVGVGGALVPEKLFDAATGQKPGGTTGPVPPGATLPMQYRNLRLVAFRIDPCFANIGPVTDPSSCLNQLRLIFQPLTFSSGATTTETDSALHAFYSLTRDQLTKLLETVIQIRQENGGTKDLGPLDVHPILERQGLTGAEATALNAAILKYAGTKNLTRFTKFESANLDTVWNFEGFDIAKNKPTLMVIPTLPSKDTTVQFFIGFGEGFAGGFTPETTSKDDMQLLGNTAAAKKASVAKQEAAFDAALRIQNPDFNSPNTIDCASCHMSGPAEIITGGLLKLSAEGNSNAFVANSKYVKAADMKQKTSVDMSDGLNLHMFSYKDSQAMIGQRVINESAVVVAYVNQNLLSGKSAE